MPLVEDKEIIPDVEELIAVIKREKKPSRVHVIELFLDQEIKDQVCERYGLDRDLNPNGPVYQVKREVIIHRFLGYDVFRVPVIRKDFFYMPFLKTEDTTGFSEQHRGQREWTEEHKGPVQSWEDFESYPWPKVSDIDLSNLEWLEKNLPSNMGCYDLTAHILEIVTFLLGYENLCYKMYDEPGLVDALCERVGQFYVEYTKLLCDFSCIKVVWGSDDMGFRTSTLTSPAFLREKILPWHKRCAQVAHQKGRPYLIHTCGNLESIMHNLIEDVGIDAKHSFEDSIMPVTEAYRKYGSRVAVLGGIDVDFLCRSDQPAVRDRVRKTLDVCMQGPGGYCLGTGNTVANYIPVENYLVMLDEGRKYRVS